MKEISGALLFILFFILCAPVALCTPASNDVAVIAALDVCSTAAPFSPTAADSPALQEDAYRIVPLNSSEPAARPSSPPHSLLIASRQEHPPQS